MPTINVSRVIKNPKFAQSFIVHRKTGSWVSHRWTQGSETDISMLGVITAPSAKELDQVPEGDRVKGVMCFHSTEEIYTTRDEGTSDEVSWKGNRYRIYQISPWVDYGYYKAIGIRMEGH